MEMTTVLVNSFFSACACLAFGFLFNIRGKNIFLAAANGGLGYFIYALLSGWNVYLALLCASIVMAAYAEVAARLRKTPVPLFLVPGLIPLVPGAGMFNAMLLLLEGQRADALNVALDTLIEAGALAAGIIIFSSVMKLVPYSFRIGGRKAKP